MEMTVPKVRQEVEEAVTVEEQMQILTMVISGSVQNCKTQLVDVMTLQTHVTVVAVATILIILNKHLTKMTIGAVLVPLLLVA